MTYAELGVRVSRMVGFGALFAWYYAFGLAWWAWFFWVPAIGIGAFFVPYVGVGLAALVGAPVEALRASDDEPPDA